MGYVRKGPAWRTILEESPRPSFMRTLLSKLVVVLMLGSFAMVGTPALAAGHLSGNWSGYVASRGEFTAVGASWVVPTLAATTTLMTDVTWVGIGGSKTRDLIQAGTHSAVENGRVQYWAWYELLPDYQQVVPLAVHGGDSVSVSLTELTPDLWYISFVNETTGAQFSKAVQYQSRKSSAEWVEEMPVVYGKSNTPIYAPLSEFGAVTFKDAYAVVDGKREPIEDTRPSVVTLVAKNNKHIDLAEPSDITDGSFVVTRSGAVPSPVASSSSRHASAGTADIVWSLPTSR